MPELIVDIPTFYCHVRNEHLYDLTKGHGETTPVAVFAVTSVPGRAIGFNVMTDWGAFIDRLPIHALCTGPGVQKMPLEVLELWDCFAVNVVAMAYDFLGGLKCRVLLKDGKWYDGRYRFTLDWHGVPLADDPGEGGHKSANIIHLDNGNFAAQPNNRCRWYEASFITKPFPERPDLLTNSHVWSAETSGQKWVTEDSDRFFYDVEVAPPGPIKVCRCGHGHSSHFGDSGPLQRSGGNTGCLECICLEWDWDPAEVAPDPRSMNPLDHDLCTCGHLREYHPLIANSEGVASDACLHPNAWCLCRKFVEYEGAVTRTATAPEGAPVFVPMCECGHVEKKHYADGPCMACQCRRFALQFGIVTAPGGKPIEITSEGHIGEHKRAAEKRRRPYHDEEGPTL